MIPSIPEQVMLHFQNHPTDFIREVLGEEPEIYQQRMSQAILENDRVAISACHDLGKSWWAARIVLWFMATHPGCKAITTAPTFNQVKNILWSEIRSAYSKSKFPLGGKMNLTEWQVTPEGDWFALGFTPRNELSGESGQGTQSSFQGFHAPHILLVFDEATGIPKPIWTMAEGILTSASVHFLAIGNPTSRMSDFYKCFSSPAWEKIKLSCFDSPNLIANQITDLPCLTQEVNLVRSMSEEEAKLRLSQYKIIKPHLLTLKWVVEAALKWGMDHPLFVSKVLGLFPTDSDDTLIPLHSVEEAQLRVYWPTASDRKIVGVDVARFGSDSTVFTALHGKKFIQKKILLKADTSQVVGSLISFVKDLFENRADVLVIDETGIGGGVVDLLREAQRDDTLWRNTEVRGVQFGSACEDLSDKEKFVNLKARMFRLLSDDLQAQEGLSLPEEDVYLDELPTLLYRYDSKGRMFIESKDDYKKRTGRRSPDHADSLALANFGRYDEKMSGRFTEDFSASEAGWDKPMASGLGENKRW